MKIELNFENNETTVVFTPAEEELFKKEAEQKKVSLYEYLSLTLPRLIAAKITLAIIDSCHEGQDL